MTVLERGYGEDTYGGELYGLAGVPTDPLMFVDVWTPTGWVNTICDVMSIDIQAGRSSYVEAFAAGTATIVYENADGRYSGWSVFGIWAEASPYRVDVPIRVRVTDLDGKQSTLFTGTTDAATDEWPDIVNATATVTATDAFKPLARYKGLPRAAVGAGELSGARVNRFLADAAYTGPKAVDAGTVPLQATTLEGVTLDLLHQVGESEWGWLYVRGDGTLVFRQRDAVQTDPRMVNVQYTFADGDDVAGAICYSDVKLPVDDDVVINLAQVTPPGIATQTATDTQSVAWFGPRTWTRTDLPINTTTDALGLAQLVVLQESTQTRRVDAVTFPAGSSSAAYTAACGIRIGDRIRFIRRYPDGYVLDAELLVNGVHHKITADGSGYPHNWDVDLTTSNALLVRDYGQWDGGLWDTALWGV